MDQGFLVEILDVILVLYPGYSGVLLLGEDDPFPDSTVGVHDEVGNEVCWSTPLGCTMKGGMLAVGGVVEEGLGREDRKYLGIYGWGVLNNVQSRCRIRMSTGRDNRRGRFVRRIASWNVKRASS